MYWQENVLLCAGVSIHLPTHYYSRLTQFVQNESFSQPHQGTNFHFIQTGKCHRACEDPSCYYQGATRANQSLTNLLANELMSGPACIFVYISTRVTCAAPSQIPLNVEYMSTTDSINATLTHMSITDAATPAINAVVNTATPALAQATQHSSTSASVHWYVITVGYETGVFQGWHNVYVHVVGIPGACFSWYSLTGAEAAYEQALSDGTVTQLSCYTSKKAWILLKDAEDLVTTVKNLAGPCTAYLQTKSFHLYLDAKEEINVQALWDESWASINGNSRRRTAFNLQPGPGNDTIKKLNCIFLREVSEAFDFTSYLSVDEPYFNYLANTSTDTLPVKTKRQHTAVDDPQKQWLPEHDNFLKEFIQLEGCRDDGWNLDWKLLPVQQLKRPRAMHTTQASI
ncbi:uncharacterized protein HD556DRAFT_1306398 [Suillus plorans]|uniref:Ribonuclease H1 N-terminal domain-containing protein n=1 Tax=Suillus plorans TaxID=116603 RepID=A0A9P7IZD0_9AGAM|nr:uncharacterized protein HD556DRAFT_1306398 [Suillus plorans]KAG1797804.1 hypothetical protein HD556DRAFT_1306398 [Suillus plorans]